MPKKKPSIYCKTCQHQGKKVPCNCCLHTDPGFDYSQWEKKDQKKEIKKPVQVRRRVFVPWSDQIDQAEYLLDDR